ncbi:MAG: Radical domain protein [Gemmatimonadetes bacterium]|nr:Radical domain protein [Gemmatimonadota bacterium]
MQQAALFDEGVLRARVLPLLDEQKDIAYLGQRAGKVLNAPEATGMGFWSINPYVGCAFGCTYCYARYAHRYTLERAAAANPQHALLASTVRDMPPWLAFERRIFVKENAPEVLRRTLRHGSDKHLALVRGETVVIGTATDPYQPAERRFRLTRGILEALSEHPGLTIGIITKSPLVTRDAELLHRLMRHSKVTVHVSLITVDRELARRIEPRAPTPESRLRAIGRLREWGIDVGVNVMPVLPGITDGPRALDALVKAVTDAGATHLNACALRLRSTARERYLPFIEQEFPALVERYRGTYGHSHQAGEKYREGLQAWFARSCERHGIVYGHQHGDEEEADAGVVPVVAAEQLGLELGAGAGVASAGISATFKPRSRQNLGKTTGKAPEPLIREIPRKAVMQ